MVVLALGAAEAGTATTSSTTTAMSFDRFKPAMWDQYRWTNRALKNRCREKFDGMASFTSTVPLSDVLPAWRDDKVRWAKGKHHRAQERSSLCVYSLASAWADTSAARCVSSKEGGIASNTGNGYYGKWQADTSFASTYNPEASRRWGPYAYYHGGAWPERDQDLMAYRGWKARGWYPWPTTARMCGLI